MLICSLPECCKEIKPKATIYGFGISTLLSINAEITVSAVGFSYSFCSLQCIKKYLKEELKDE